MDGALNMKISIIVPVLNEAAVIAETLRAVGSVHEVIVVDGGSADGTVEAARPFATRVLTAPRGRARQMNIGAAAATGDVLLFLHADTRLPERFAPAVAEALKDPRVAWGRFDLRLSGRRRLFRVIERLINLRARLTRIATGDQALFVRRAVFEAAGGFPDEPLMEDIALARRLKHLGKMASIAEPVVTDSRRWERAGLWKTVALMWLLRLLYFAGASPRRLHAWYRDVR
jgi:rSAM/selenodomain-associated transferase 2